MRSIQFRGKRLGNGEWVYGNLVEKAFDGTSKTVDIGIQKSGYYPIEVDPATVGQFTGLRDKNGKEIYEGDICSLVDFDHNKRIEEIVYIAGSFCLGRCISLRQTQTDNYKYVGDSIEVIGNIHENPELITA
jgi:uncharacterized phage protein (TIGR01671 family)